MQRTLIAFGIGRRATPMVALAMLAIGTVSGRAADISGSGVVIGTHGEILTNAHVVKNCKQITVRSSSGDLAAAMLVTRDEKNDLAVVRTKFPLSRVAAFRGNSPIRAGDAVVVLGYPLAGLLATTANLSVGNVSALAGLGDDSRYLQISAPVQPGNSGGPMLDASGHLVGIVTSKLNAAVVARFTGDIPQNVNFALKAEVARTFLESKGIAYQTAHSDQQLSPADVGDIARPFTVRIECEQAVSRTAMTPPPVASPSAPSRAATARVFRADFYLAGCKDFLAGESNFFSGRCEGTVEVLSALTADTKVFCAPENATNVQRVQVVVSYIEVRPERQNEDFRLFANEAMAKAWPCKK
jgi:hypothetical protein